MRQVIGVIVVLDETVGTLARISKNSQQMLLKRGRQALFFQLRKCLLNGVARGNGPEQQAALVIKNHVTGLVAKGPCDKTFFHDVVFELTQKNGSNLVVPNQGHSQGQLGAIVV